MKDKNNKLSIGLKEVVTFVITWYTMFISSQTPWYYKYLPEWYVTWYLGWIDMGLAIFFIIIFGIMGLSAGNIEKISADIADLSWNINDPITTVKEKLVAIKSQLDRFGIVYNNIFEEIPFKTEVLTFKGVLKEKIKIFAHRTVSGRLDLPQLGIWCSYSAYILLIKLNYFSIPEPFIYILVMVFIIGLGLNTVNINGVGEIVSDIIKEAREDVPNPHMNLSSILSSLKTLCSKYNIISKHVIAKTGKSITDFVNETSNLIIKQNDENNKKSEVIA